MSSSDPDIQKNFISSKAPDAPSRSEKIAEEIAASSDTEVAEKQMTIFPKENGKPFFFDYQWKGFFKDSCGALLRCGDTEMSKESSKIKAYKKIIDGCIFPYPRKIFINMNGDMGRCERPLRAQTMQGERIALSSSEAIPAGSTCMFSVILLSDDYLNPFLEWMDYGKLRGTGQWRSSGKGRFTYEVLAIDELVCKTTERVLPKRTVKNVSSTFVTDVISDSLGGQALVTEKSSDDTEVEKPHRGRPKKNA
jgi:hypothetical protein